MRRRLSIVLALVCLASPSWAADGNILLVFDAQSGDCDLTIPCNCSGTLYVYALLQGASTSGITGAEYKIAIGPTSNPDPGWLFFETFDANATVLGTGALNPVDNLPRGVNVAWGSCQQGDGFMLLIETVTILNVDCPFPSPETRLRVVKHDTASNAHFQCPLFTLCDAPVYTKVCLGSNLTSCPNPNPPFANDAICSTSGEAWLNPGPGRVCCLSCEPASADCEIQVEGSTWSGLKSLYWR